MTDWTPPGGNEVHAGGPGRSWHRPVARGAIVCTICAAIAAGGYAAGGVASAAVPAAATATAATTPTTLPGAPGWSGGVPGAPGWSGGGLPGRPGGPPGEHREFRGAMGIIAAVGATSVTLTEPDGTEASFATNGSTTYHEGLVKVGRSALAVGDRVLVRTTVTSGSTVSHVAAAVEVVLAEVSGKVLSVSGSKVVVQDPEGFWRTVQISPSTVLDEAGKSVAASKIVSGSYVLVSGTIAADHQTLDAVGVTIFTPGKGGQWAGGGASFEGPGRGGPALAWGGQGFVGGPGGGQGLVFGGGVTTT